MAGYINSEMFLLGKQSGTLGKPSNVEFTPEWQSFKEPGQERETNILQPIVCKANFPARIEIFKLKGDFDQTPGMGLPKGVSIVRKVTEATIVFDDYAVGDCFNGTYVCSVTDKSGHTIMKVAHVNLEFYRPDAGM